MDRLTPIAASPTASSEVATSGSGNTRDKKIARHESQVEISQASSTLQARRNLAGAFDPSDSEHDQHQAEVSQAAPGFGFSHRSEKTCGYSAERHADRARLTTQNGGDANKVDERGLPHLPFGVYLAPPQISNKILKSQKHLLWVSS